MNILTIREDMTVDLRTIAEGCGIDPKSAMQLLRDHLETMQESFGLVRFENAKLPGRGRPEKIALLTEDQATFFVALCQNTKPVVQFKAALVRAFSEAKRRMAENQLTGDQIKAWVQRDYFRRTRPIHDFGSQSKDGRYRVGYRGPTYTVSAGRLDDAAMVAADRLHLDDSQMMLFAEDSK